MLSSGLHTQNLDDDHIISSALVCSGRECCLFESIVNVNQEDNNFVLDDVQLF
jgi:hypothetical protein